MLVPLEFWRWVVYQRFIQLLQVLQSFGRRIILESLAR